MKKNWWVNLFLNLSIAIFTILVLVLYFFQLLDINYPTLLLILLSISTIISLLVALIIRGIVFLIGENNTKKIFIGLGIWLVLFIGYQLVKPKSIWFIISERVIRFDFCPFHFKFI